MSLLDTQNNAIDTCDHIPMMNKLFLNLVYHILALGIRGTGLMGPDTIMPVFCAAYKSGFALLLSMSRSKLVSSLLS